jgi:hypothetical protein
MTGFGLSPNLDISQCRDWDGSSSGGEGVSVAKSVAKGGSFVEIHEAVAELMTADPRLELVRDFEFTPRTLD